MSLFTHPLALVDGQKLISVSLIVSNSVRPYLALVAKLGRAVDAGGNHAARLLRILELPSVPILGETEDWAAGQSCGGLLGTIYVRVHRSWLLFPSLLKIHTVPTRLFILDHLKIVRTQPEWLQYSIT